MPRHLTTKDARKMQAARKLLGGGRKKIPTPCPKCGTMCPGYRIAVVHCS